ncbi:MAG: hypothetical protein ACI4EB_05535 [Bilifractor sp.]
MGDRYGLDKIGSMQFKTIEMLEFDDGRNSGASYRMTSMQLAGMPRNFEDMNELRVRLDEYYYDRLGGKEAQLETKCQISSNLFHKYLRFKGGRNITYENLAKFCVGVSLTVEEADELFRYRGKRLDVENLCDYILMCELENNGDIYEYIEDMKKYAGVKIHCIGEE